MSNESKNTRHALAATREKNIAPLPAPYLVAFEEIQRDPNAQILIALQNSHVVACLQLNILANLTLTGTKRGLIEGVRVTKSIQGQGHQLFQAAIQIGKENNCAMVQLTTNNLRDGAAKIYENLGFTASHIGFKLPLDAA